MHMQIRLIHLFIYDELRRPSTLCMGGCSVMSTTFGLTKLSSS